MHFLMDDVELGWSEILTLGDLLLREWLGLTEYAKLRFCDGAELGFRDGIALGTKLGFQKYPR